MKTTEVRYRKVSPDAVGRIRCTAVGRDRRWCSEWATWCRQWQTSGMTAPAFWYACDEHAKKMAEDDGLSLEPDAPGFADHQRHSIALEQWLGTSAWVWVCTCGASSKRTWDSRYAAGHAGQNHAIRQRQKEKA